MKLVKVQNYALDVKKIYMVEIEFHDNKLKSSIRELDIIKVGKEKLFCYVDEFDIVASIPFDAVFDTKENDYERTDSLVGIHKAFNTPFIDKDNAHEFVDRYTDEYIEKCKDIAKSVTVSSVASNLISDLESSIVELYRVDKKKACEFMLKIDNTFKSENIESKANAKTDNGGNS
jgi:hypothetical protein